MISTVKSWPEIIMGLNIRSTSRDIAGVSSLAIEYAGRRIIANHAQNRRTREKKAAGIRETYFPKLGCVFVHIPKTAGTSIHTMLSAYENATEAKHEGARENHTLNHKGPLKHKKAHELRDLFGDEQWNSVYSFTFVRNPWDLMVSSYHWWIQKGHTFRDCLLDALIIRRMENFDEFIRSHYGMCYINNVPGYSMSDWFSANNEDLVSHVAKIEELDVEIRYVLAQLGINEQPASMPHLNKSMRGDYRSYYNEETRSMVAKRFSDIIERFEYCF